MLSFILKMLSPEEKPCDHILTKILSFSFFFFETKSYYITLVGLKLYVDQNINTEIHLLLPAEWWG